MSSFAMAVDRAHIESVIGQLREGFENAVRPAAQAGAQVIYDGMKANVAKLGRVTGNLDNAIYQKFSPERSIKGIKATYNVSWNWKKAPHGGLVEFGHIQRYAAYVGDDGQWHTAVRPDARGKPRPGGRASHATKDAYYVLRKGGPVHVPAKPFARPTLDLRPQVIAAIEHKFISMVTA